jgi:hypothetical protein
VRAAYNSTCSRRQPCLNPPRAAHPPRPCIIPAPPHVNPTHYYNSQPPTLDDLSFSSATSLTHRYPLHYKNDSPHALSAPPHSLKIAMSISIRNSRRLSVIFAEEPIRYDLLPPAYNRMLTSAPLQAHTPRGRILCREVLRAPPRPHMEARHPHPRQRQARPRRVVPPRGLRTPHRDRSGAPPQRTPGLPYLLRTITSLIS